MRGLKSYAAGNFAFKVDSLGGHLGFVKQVGGGKISNEIVTHDMGPSQFRRHSAGNLVYDPITVQVGLGMSNKFYEWLRQTFNQNPVQYSGEIHQLDGAYNSRAVREFHDAHIQEVTFPTLDVDGKEGAYMTLKLDPEEIIYARGTGGSFSPTEGDKFRDWTLQNFVFDLGPLPCDNIRKIESFTWKVSTVAARKGKDRRASKVTGKVEIPSLKLEIDAKDFQDWSMWAQGFIARGQSGAGTRYSGGIHLLDQGRDKELATMSLLNVGPTSLQMNDSTANEDKIQTFSVELFVEDLEWKTIASAHESV
jgi:hypothetical protein